VTEQHPSLLGALLLLLPVHGLLHLQCLPRNRPLSRLLALVVLETQVFLLQHFLLQQSHIHPLRIQARHVDSHYTNNVLVEEAQALLCHLLNP
jgi:hypothetical protein